MFKVILIIVAIALAGYGSSDSIAGIARHLLSVIPFPSAVKAVSRQANDFIQPAKIKFPEKEAVETIRSSLREGVSAVASSSSSATASSGMAEALAGPKPEEKPAKNALTVTSNVSDPDVKIMNIRPKYRDGIELAPGKYEILVEKQGYRSNRFWVELEGSRNADNTVTLDVELDPLGLPACASKLEISNHAGAFTGDGGNIIQYQATFEGVDMNDLYRSYAKEVEGVNYYFVYDTVVLPGYVEFHIATPTTIGKDDISENKYIDVSMKRYNFLRVIFEQSSSDVLFTTQVFMPPAVAVTEIDKEFICENVFVF